MSTPYTTVLIATITLVLDGDQTVRYHQVVVWYRMVSRRIV